MALDIQDVRAMREEAADLRELSSHQLNITDAATAMRIAEALEYYADQLKTEWEKI